MRSSKKWRRRESYVVETGFPQRRKGRKGRKENIVTTEITENTEKKPKEIFCLFFLTAGHHTDEWLDQTIPLVPSHLTQRRGDRETQRRSKLGNFYGPLFSFSLRLSVSPSLR